MTRFTLLTSSLTAAAFFATTNGCGQSVRPQPGTAAVVLDVTAKPKDGTPKRFTHVAVYDRAPKETVATGQFERVDYANLGDIVVWLEPAPADATAPAPLTVPFDPTTPSTDVYAAAVGQQVLLKNRRNLPALGLYSVSDGNEFQMEAIKPLSSAVITVQSPGVIEILADPSMPPVAVIYASPSPWVARTRAGEKVVFENVPPGNYEAISWHPRLPGKSAAMSLSPDEVTRATLDVGVNNITPEGPQP